MIKRQWRAWSLAGLLMLVVGATGQRGVGQAVPAASPTFEVSTVKVNRSGGSGSYSNFRNGVFTATDVSLKNVMEDWAFGIPEARIVGGPKWLASERFDIEAKLNAQAAGRLEKLDRQQRGVETHALFQQLLADRFKLAFHWETQGMPVYALVVAKKGSLLQEAKPNGDTGISLSAGKLTAEGVTMDGLARTLTQELSQELGRVVVNRTGILGRYNLTLRWTPQNDEPKTDNGAEADAASSIFTAIQEQLGLKLESARGLVQVLAIDHLEMPTEN
jgi:uncharacterized protein (TIGR03435 family)